MGSSTNSFFVPTYSFTQGSSAAVLEDEAMKAEKTWNDWIAKNGNYDITIYDSWSYVVDLREKDTSDIYAALESSQEYIANYYPWLIDNADSIVVIDDRTYSYDGLAYVGLPTRHQPDRENFVGGSNGGPTDLPLNVAYVCDYGPGSIVSEHELGHMYGGHHTRHRYEGFPSYSRTIMGNYGDKDCHGNSGISTDTRQYYSCVQSDIRYYMDYWNI